MLSAFSKSTMSQQSFPIDPESGNVYYEGTKRVLPKSKKKIFKRVVFWASKKQDFPPAVFSTIYSSNDTLIIKVVTEVPSAKRLHPISFKSRIVVSKQSFSFTAEHFYFEDVKLSLDQWLEKYADSENERHKKNLTLITKGLDSHVFLTFENLKKIINNEKAVK